jgi:carboxymethylenebutenolidase
MKMQWTLAVLTAAFCVGCGQKPDETTDYPARMAQEHREDRPVASPAAMQDSAHPIRTQTVEYGSIGGQPVYGHLAYPAEAEGGLPAVLVFHEWWGLNDNIRSMANRLAGEGYVALAADLYLGRTADTPDAARALLDETLKDTAALSTNLRQAHAFLREEIKAARIGTIGWCFGGMLSLRTALLMPDAVDATVIYYGHVPGDPEELRKLKAPVLGIFGSADQGIPLDSVRRFEAALKSLGVPAEIHVYEGADHAFANPSGKNYRAEAAEDAWNKALGFLHAHLRGD